MKIRHVVTARGTFKLEYVLNAPVYGLITYAPTVRDARRLARIALQNDDIRAVKVSKLIEVFRRDD